MAKERINKEVKTHLNCVAIYDNFAERYEKKHGIAITYTEVTKLIAEKINAVGGIKL